MEEDDDDKQYEPSQKRLDDARQKGEVPRSADLTTAAGYGGFLIAAAGLGPGSLLALGTILAGMLSRADTLSGDAFAGGSSALAGGLLSGVGSTIAPLFLLPAALALLVLLGQRAIIFAPTKIEPKLSRISPFATAKQKFGRAGLFEFGKSFVKLCLYSAILCFYLSDKLPELMATVAMEPGLIVSEFLRLTLGLLFIVLVIAVALGLVDYLWQQAEHTRKHRMTRKEMTDEAKESEGDPHMKGQRRQKGIAIAMNQMLKDVQTADVVIVNPTHYAIALKWDRASKRAPVCVAKGVDEIAARIREVAQENAVPIHSDPPTARALHATIEIGQEIPHDHYRAVAAAIRFAEAIRKKARPTW